jgi:hypothetical protein
LKQLRASKAETSTRRTMGRRRTVFCPNTKKRIYESDSDRSGDDNVVIVDTVNREGEVIVNLAEPVEAAADSGRNDLVAVEEAAPIIVSKEKEREGTVVVGAAPRHRLIEGAKRKSLPEAVGTPKQKDVEVGYSLLKKKKATATNVAANNSGVDLKAAGSEEVAATAEGDDDSISVWSDSSEGSGLEERTAEQIAWERSPAFAARTGKALGGPKGRSTAADKVVSRVAIIPGYRKTKLYKPFNLFVRGKSQRFWLTVRPRADGSIQIGAGTEFCGRSSLTFKFSKIEWDKLEPIEFEGPNRRKETAEEEEEETEPLIDTEEPTKFKPFRKDEEDKGGSKKSILI